MMLSCCQQEMLMLHYPGTGPKIVEPTLTWMRAGLQEIVLSKQSWAHHCGARDQHTTVMHRLRHMDMQTHRQQVHTSKRLIQLHYDQHQLTQDSVSQCKIRYNVGSSDLGWDQIGVVVACH